MSLVPPPAPSGFALPEPLRSLAEWGFALQRTLTADMREQLVLIRDGGGWEPFAAIILAAFLYGVFHAIGPGHGKVVIGSWFATRRARVVHGLAACFLSAMVQGASAIAAVLLLAGMFSLAPRQVMAQAAWLEAGSYALITAMGAWMLVQAFRGHASCGHDHAHHHDHACCDHHHPDETEERRTLWAMAAAVGFRPCSGAILVLLFCLANAMMWVGVAATFAMALGVGLTVSGIGLSALGLNRLLDRRINQESRLGRLLRRVLSLAGAGAILVLGLVLLLGVIQHGPTLTG
ncbi:MAG: ABC transporter [Magnetospirillum sp.]|nr:ABC transporter [Magnetospirillum sp.]